MAFSFQILAPVSKIESGNLLTWLIGHTYLQPGNFCGKIKYAVATNKGKLVVLVQSIQFGKFELSKLIGL